MPGHDYNEDKSLVYYLVCSSITQLKILLVLQTSKLGFILFLFSVMLTCLLLPHLGITVNLCFVLVSANIWSREAT